MRHLFLVLFCLSALMLGACGKKPKVLDTPDPNWDLHNNQNNVINNPSTMVR